MVHACNDSLVCHLYSLKYVSVRKILWGGLACNHCSSIVAPDVVHALVTSTSVGPRIILYNILFPQRPVVAKAPSGCFTHWARNLDAIEEHCVGLPW
jgi:hypothetical protein